MEVLIKSPSKCTDIELATFEQFVSEGGEVIAAGLRQRIEQAKKLVFIKENECVAVGAIKKPNSRYKSSVFTKAGVSEKSKDFKYELGWLYVTPSARGKGFGGELMYNVTELLNGSGCFATTREDNHSMHHLLSQYSFNRLGSVYQSDNGDYSLVLYVYQPKHTVQNLRRKKDANIAHMANPAYILKFNRRSKRRTETHSICLTLPKPPDFERMMIDAR